MRCYEIVNLLLSFRQRFFVSCSKLLSAIERVCMPVQVSAGNQIHI